MDLPALLHVLQLALSQNHEERKLAEDKLTESASAPGHIVALLKVVVATEVDGAVRQFASIQFKNAVAKGWGRTEEDGSEGKPSAFNEHDRAVVRDNILEAIVQAPPVIRAQLAETFRLVARADFPHAWPGLLARIEANLRVSDEGRILGTLLALKMLAKLFMYSDDSERAPLLPVMASTFPLLLGILRYCLQLPAPAPSVGMVMCLVVKCLRAFTHKKIPPQLLESGVGAAWMGALLMVIECQVPTAGMPVDPAQRMQWPWWKLKKWALIVAYRVQRHVGAVGRDPPPAPELHKFVVAFKKSWEGRILLATFRMLEAVRAGGEAEPPDRVVHAGLLFLTGCLHHDVAFTVMKQHMDALILELIFPLLCWRDADERLWHDDPDEFIRAERDVILGFYSVKDAAANFLQELVRKRGQEYIDPFLAHLAGLLKSAQALPLNARPAREISGAFFALMALAKHLKRTKPFCTQLEHLLVSHVFPEFLSPYGFLRAKASQVAAKFADIDFTVPSNFTNAAVAMLQGLRTDPDLPVRVHYALGLSCFVKSCEDLAAFREHLPLLLHEMVRLMDDVECDDVVLALHSVAKKFGPEMAPHAGDLVQRLLASFWKSFRAAEAQEDEDSEEAMAASSCLRAVTAVLEAVSTLPEMYAALEPLLVPVARELLSSEGEEYMDEVLELLGYLTAFAPEITPGMWTLWNPMLDCLKEFAIESFDAFLLPLDNLISRDPTTFLTSTAPNYQQSLFDMLAWSLEQPDFDDSLVEAAPQLMESVLQACRGGVDVWVEPYLRVALTKLASAERGVLKDQLMLVVANCLYYNPQLTVGALVRLGALGSTFQALLQMLALKKETRSKVEVRAHFGSEHDKKVLVLGLVSLLGLPEEAMPPEMRAGFVQVFQALLQLLNALKEQMDKRKQREDADDDDDEDDEDAAVDEDEDEEDGGDEGEEDEEDEDDNDNDDGRYLFQLGLGEDDSDIDDWDEDEYGQPSVDYKSPIDDIDPFVFFADAVKGLAAVLPARHHQLTSGLDFPHQALAHGLEAHAEERRAELINKAKEEAQTTQGAGQCLS